MKKEDYVDYFIKSAWHSLSRLYNQKAQQYGMTTSVAYVLLNISSSEGTPATKIAPAIGLETRSLTRILRSLEEKGYIFREPDPDDGRSVRIFLTDVGKENKARAVETVKAFNEYIRTKIPEAKLKIFREVSGRILDLVEHDEVLKETVKKA
jgi:DNA-binding MarR family transcriptional regulator